MEILNRKIMLGYKRMKFIYACYLRIHDLTEISITYPVF